MSIMEITGKASYCCAVKLLLTVGTCITNKGPV